jgi:hypothetical protein
MVETAAGRDYILCSQKPQTLEIKTSDGPLKAAGSVLIRSVNHRGVEDWKFSK